MDIYDRYTYEDEKREALEKWLQERRVADATDKEVSIQSTGSIEQAKLSTMVIDQDEPLFDKQEKVAQTYSQPQTESKAGDSEAHRSSSSEPVLDSEA